jgi:pimeloyl-ACP methyl ester carboxylesterase
MNRITVGGSEVAFKTFGSGPTLMMLHGTSTDGVGTFRPVMDRFTGRRTLVLPDYGGCGESRVQEGELSLSSLAAQVAAVIRATATESVDLVGFSLGAAVATAAAVSYPELVRRLILVGGWAWTGSPHLRLVFQTWHQLESIDSDLGNRYGISLAFSPRFLNELGHERIESMVRHRSPTMKQRVSLGLKLDIRDMLKSVRQRTLTVALLKDQFIGAEPTEELHSLVQTSELQTVDAPHAVFAERPEKIASVIAEFLASA